jgi:hypothetical protein
MISDSSAFPGPGLANAIASHVDESPALKFSKKAWLRANITGRDGSFGRPNSAACKG